MSDIKVEATENMLSYLILPMLWQSSGNKMLITSSNKQDTDHLFINEIEKNNFKILQSGSSSEGLNTGFRSPIITGDPFSFTLEVDIDLMAVSNTYKASSTPDLSNLHVFESQHPGYVMIYDKYGYVFSSSIFIKECLKSCEKIWSKMKFLCLKSVNFCGPAVTIQVCNSLGYLRSFDIVWAIKHIDWPPNARLFQKSLYWPSYKITSEIIKRGCHIVPIGYKWSQSFSSEWRLSFSEAEIMLADSLSKLQKETYVVFKHLMKSVVRGPKSYTTYCLKNAFFLFVESYDGDWSYANILDIVKYLLVTFKEYLCNGFLPQYFIPTNNLISQYDRKTITEKLNEITTLQTNFIEYFNINSDKQLGLNIPIQIISYHTNCKELYNMYQTSRESFIDACRLNIIFTCLVLAIQEEKDKSIALIENMFTIPKSFDSIEILVDDLLDMFKTNFCSLSSMMSVHMIEGMIYGCFMLHANIICCNKRARILIKLASFIEKFTKFDEEFTNSCLLNHIIVTVRRNTPKNIIKDIHNFVECFKDNRINLRFEELVLCIIHSLSDMAISYTCRNEDLIYAINMNKAALFIAVEFYDKEETVCKLSKNLMTSCDEVLSMCNKSYAIEGIVGINDCLEALSHSEVDLQQFVADTSCQFANHLWNYVMIDTTFSLNSDSFANIEQHFRLAFDICIDNTLIYLIHYARFLIHVNKCNEAIRLLHKFEDDFNNHKELIVEFSTPIQFTFCEPIRFAIGKSGTVEFHVGIFRYWLLYSAYKEINDSENMIQIKDRMFLQSKLSNENMLCNYIS